jgi:hypothetical protein
MHADIAPILRANLAREPQLMTDKAAGYKIVGKEFASHDAVDHSRDEYARYEGDKVISTNTVARDRGGDIVRRDEYGDIRSSAFVRNSGARIGSICRNGLADSSVTW